MAVLAFSGCAASRAFQEGQARIAAGDAEGGLSKLEEASRRDPRNAEYRIALASQRFGVVQKALVSGEQALKAGRPDEAERQYQAVIRVDGRHAMARQGLEDVRRERRAAALLSDVDNLLMRGGASALNEASEKLREVLVASPGHRQALTFKQRLEEAQDTQARPQQTLAAVYRKPITLEFRDAPLKSVFDLVAKLSGLNFYFDKDVRTDQKTTVLARNASIEEAVHLVLASNQLQQKVLNGNSLFIYPDTPAKLKEYQTLLVRSFYVVNADVKAVVNTLKTIVKTRDIVFDERVGIIIIRDTPQAVRMAERIVALQDMTDPEVMLDVEVMEVKRSRLLELGIQWPGQMSLTPLSTSQSPLSLSTLRSITAGDIQVGVGNAFINARKEEQDGNILANPRIRVRNKEKAKILIGDKVPVITSTTTATGFSSESVTYLDVGLKLDVEPSIHLDEEVAIKVNLEVSNIVREVASKGVLSYQIGTRGASTVLRLKDGETQILAGLISDEDRSSANKIPGLGEMPILGRLFGSQKDDTQRNEILLSITPRVVRTLRRPDLNMMEFESGTESHIGAETIRLTPLQADPKNASLAPRDIESQPVADLDALQDALSFSWRAPASVKVGEPLVAALWIDSVTGLLTAPLLLEFEAGGWEMVAVTEGSYFKQGNAATSFSAEVDATQGRVSVKVGQQMMDGPLGKAMAKGRGELLTVTMRPLRPMTSGSALRLVSVAPQPALTQPIALPKELIVKVDP